MAAPRGLTHRTMGRLTEAQKQTVTCPKCGAAPGHPCKMVSKTGMVVGGLLVNSHDKRKAMAAYKQANAKLMEKERAQ
jgi:hypothetical protein